MHCISGVTAVYGIIGDPIEHTFSPLMQNSAMEVMGIDGVYIPFRVMVCDLKPAIRAVSALHIRGLNVTVPHKTAVIPFLDQISDAAKAVGAVNTIINKNNELCGENTDVYGFEQCVLRGGGIALFPSRICVIGAGGAARGVIYACARRSEVEEITVLNRTLSRARDVIREFGFLTGKRIIAAPIDVETQRTLLPHAGMIVNTTTVGMFPDSDQSPIADPSVFHSGQIVCDIIYNPLRTRFLREAAEHGARTVEGVTMLAYQGAQSLSLWTGKEAPAEVMLEVLRKRLQG